MPNMRAKGQKFVNEAIELYRQAGFTCWKPGNKAVWIPDRQHPGRRMAVSQSQDIFGCFDFVATCQHSIHWVQVKAQESHASEARTAIDKLPMPLHTLRIVLCRVDKKPKHFLVWQFDRTSIWRRGSIEGKIQLVKVE